MIDHEELLARAEKLVPELYTASPVDQLFCVMDFVQAERAAEARACVQLIESIYPDCAASGMFRQVLSNAMRGRAQGWEESS